MEPFAKKPTFLTFPWVRLLNHGFPIRCFVNFSYGASSLYPETYHNLYCSVSTSGKSTDSIIANPIIESEKESGFFAICFNLLFCL